MLVRVFVAAGSGGIVQDIKGISMNTLLSRAIAVALLATAGVASAATASVTVDSKLNSISDGAGFLNFADTGIALSYGETFTINVDPNQIWNNSDPDASYESNANGHAAGTANHPNFLYGFDNFVAPYGALVGQIDGGAYFLVGTSYSGQAANAGELKLFYWDSDSWNNVGAVTANIAAIPEPTNMALLGLALGAFALTRRRKA